MEMDSSYRSKDKFAVVRNLVASWAELEPVLGRTLCHDVGSTLQDGDQVIVRRFFDWVAAQGDEESRTLVSDYRDGALGKPAQVSAHAIADIILRFISINETHFADDWPRKAQGAIGRLFQALGEMSGRWYPSFNTKILPKRRLFKTPNRSLGRLGWSALDGIAPHERDASALESVKSAARLVFENCERIFEFGQRTLSSETPPPGVNPIAWTKVKNLLLSTNTGLVGTGRTVQSHSYVNTNLGEIWVGAGLDRDLVPRQFMEALAVHNLALTCLGASTAATLSVKILFCCCTGWNRTQIENLPVEPYAYRDQDEAGLGEAAFLSEFKARAGHFVSGLLERGFRNPTLSVEQRHIVWDDTQRSAPNQASDVVNDGFMLDVMDRYVKLTEPLRVYDRDGKFSDRFFLSLAQKGLTTGSDHTIAEGALGGVLSETGVTFPVIRQTFINCTRRRLGSLEATKHLSNNTGTAIILSHYDDYAMQQELDEATAFWQNCIQAELVRSDESLRIVLKVPDSELEWFENLSIVAGISAAIGIKSRKLAVSERQFLEFIPSEDALAELYLVRRSLMHARSEIDARRWAIQGLPLLAFVSAIRRHSFETGFGRLYLRAARRSFRELRNGKTILPTLFTI